jgi:hypothetical protein
MIDIIVKIAGSILCLGAGVVMLAFGLMILIILFMEINRKLKEVYK